jgi:Family of unknown function (DUF5832)
MSKDEVEDYLTEDPEISSQKVVLLSFLSPEKILANKDLFFFREFLQDYDLQWKTSKLEEWMAGQLSQINDRLEKLAGSLDCSGNQAAAGIVRSQELNVARFVEEFQEHKRKSLKEMRQTEIQQEFDDFVFKNGAKLEDEFFAKNEFRTTIRGIKIRGVFASEAEASARAKRLQKADPNFNIYMGAVGKWMAWDPDPSRVSKQEYANEQLNTLMQKYRENEESRDEFYQTQKQRRVGTAKVKEQEQGQVEDQPTASTAVEGSSSYDGMFSGPADLAIQRKMQKKD